MDRPGASFTLSARSQPNGFGVYDMLGNVGELCGDWANWEYYKGSPTKDPSGPPKGNDRVTRGGSWQAEPGICRSAYRGWFGPANRHETLGFRVARGLTAVELKTASSVPAIAESNDELIKNPGCEELDADAKIASWEVKDGSWTRGNKDFPPFEANAFFSPGPVAQRGAPAGRRCQPISPRVSTKTRSRSPSRRMSEAGIRRQRIHAALLLSSLVKTNSGSGRGRLRRGRERGPLETAGMDRSLRRYTPGGFESA